MDLAIRIRRPVMQDEERAAFRGLPDAAVEVHLFPAGEQSRLCFGQTRLHRKIGLGQKHSGAIVARLGVGFFGVGHFDQACEVADISTRSSRTRLTPGAKPGGKFAKNPENPLRRACKSPGRSTSATVNGPAYVAKALLRGDGTQNLARVVAVLGDLSLERIQAIEF